VEFPSADWYDYWTGERIPDPPPNADPNPNAPPAAAEQVALSINVHPTLDALPVYVRGGAIMPIQPLVQSTGETPQGPLTLRVYAGDDCRGSLYTDDGESFAFERGSFLRMNFTCSVTNDGIEITVSKHEGAYASWWKNLRFEIYGWAPSRGTVQQDGQSSSIPIEHGKNFVAVSVPDLGTDTTLKLE
jgi:alpha-glucosidase